LRWSVIFWLLGMFWWDLLIKFPSELRCNTSRVMLSQVLSENSMWLLYCLARSNNPILPLSLWKSLKNIMQWNS
jgi:hypothetical protein